MPYVKTQVKEERVFSLAKVFTCEFLLYSAPNSQEFYYFKTSALLWNFNLPKRFTTNSLWENWWSDSLWSHHSSLLRKPHLNWMLLKIFLLTFYTGIVHLGFCPVKEPGVLDSHFFQHKFLATPCYSFICNQTGQKNMQPDKTPDMSAEKTLCPSWCGAEEEIRI